MKLSLDVNLSRNLRNKFNERLNFSMAKTAKFRCPDGKEIEQASFNAVCAVLDRIDSLVVHCCSLEIDSSTSGIFAFYDLLNYGQTLIDCIELIAQIYDYKSNVGTSCSHFKNSGNNNKGTDEKYFKYLRSLCTVHPVETNHHKEYQGNQPEWCPYIGPVNTVTAWTLPAKDRNADFVAIIYRNDMTLQKYLPIYVDQVFSYIESRYNEINDIIKAIDNYNQDCISKLKSNNLMLPSSFPSYDTYLRYLDKEIKVRHENCCSIAKRWAAIFRTNFSDTEQQKALEQYKAALKKHIACVHNALQTMDCVNDFDFEIDFSNAYSFPKFNKFHYHLSKLPDLIPSYELEQNPNWTFDFIDDTDESARGYGDPVYARRRLKNVADALSSTFTFDFSQNNWHLWLQFEVAMWLSENDVS